MLELSKALMHKFDYDYNKNKYGNNSRLLFTDTDSLMYEIKIEDVYENFSNNKEISDFSSYSTYPKCYGNWNKLVVGKMKDETACVAIEEFVGLRPKIYSYLIDDNSDQKYFVATIRHILLNKKYLRHSMNRIQSEDHRIGTYEISKISLPCFDDRIYIQNIECDVLVLSY